MNFWRKSYHFIGVSQKIGQKTYILHKYERGFTMNETAKGGLMSKKIFNSRIKSANTQASEKWFGYFFGPCLMYMVYYGVAGTYLTQFYTDVLGIAEGALFLTLFPLLSKIVDAVTNIFMGRIIDKTKTKQGKARPWLLLSGVLIFITGILLYTVPNASTTVQYIWIVASYNLFFAFAFTIYNMSHALMVPLSTRNTKQRDTLAMFTSMGASMIPGFLVVMIMPYIIAAVGVGSEAHTGWITMMSIVSICAIPAVLMEYYFTKERVTEDAAASAAEQAQVISFKKQMKACFTDKYWCIIMAVWLLYQISQYLATNVMLYYCNWVLADSVTGGATMQVIVNAVGQAPLGFGVFILWPLVRKFGKQKVSVIGYFIAAIGGAMLFFFGGSLGSAIGGLLIKSIGLLPTYVFMAMLAEALDHIEYKNGFRADGFSASVYSIIITVSAGISQSIILGGIGATGYITPESSDQVIQQPDSVITFFKLCFGGIPAIMYLIMAVILIWFTVGKMIPQISEELVARRKAEAEARGEVYLSPEEKAALEQEENDRIAEENRVAELKAKCEKKGLNYDEEEAKYQAKLAEAKAKEEAKKAAKEAKAAKKKK